MKTNFKKYIAIALTFAMILSFAACAKKVGPTEPDPEPTPAPLKAAEIRLGGLTGPTTIGIVNLLDNADNGKTENTYKYQIESAADALTPLMIKGELDVLIAPANLASVLYNKTEGKVQMLAVDVLGVLSILAKGVEINSWDDLKGQTIYATGKGSTPEYNLNYLLAQHGLEVGKDVIVEFKSEPTEIVALAKTTDTVVAMLPQPFATVAQTQVEGLTAKFDLTEEWDKLGNGSRMITACVMVRKQFAEENPDAIKLLLTDVANSIEWVKANPDQAAPLVEKYINVKAAIAGKAIPKCNLVCITGDEMKTAVNGYFKVLFDQAPASLGGKMPADDFFCVVK